MKIEDCYIVSGDDCIAVKSGWDQYGIAYAMPTKQVIVRRLTCTSPTSAVIAVGSEMSGGVDDVRAEDITALNSEVAVRIKTAVGRGGYVKNIFAKNMSLSTMKYTFRLSGNYGSYADDGWDRDALPEVTGISLSDVVSENTSMAGRMEGLVQLPFSGICMSNVKVELSASPKKVQWNCTGVEGVSEKVSPQPCDALVGKGLKGAKGCPYPTSRLPIDDVVLKECSIPEVRV